MRKATAWRVVRGCLSHSASDQTGRLRRVAQEQFSIWGEHHIPQLFVRSAQANDSMVLKKGKSKAQTARQQREADERRPAAEASASDAADGNADDSAESEIRLAGVYRSTGALKSAVYTNRALSALCVHPGTCTWRLAPCVYIPVHAQGA